MKRTQIYLTEKQRAALAREAKTSGKSLAAVIRDAVDKHLKGTR